MWRLTEDIVGQAAHNNAVWCDAVCSTHADLVTLTGAADIALQTEALATLIHDASGKSLAVQDSFNRLGLVGFGFTRCSTRSGYRHPRLERSACRNRKTCSGCGSRVTLILPAGNRHGSGLPRMGISHLSAKPPVCAPCTICLRPRRRRARRRRRIGCCCRCNRRVQCVRVPNCHRGRSAWIQAAASFPDCRSWATRAATICRCAPGRLQDRGTLADLRRPAVANG
jgi:hypothetical protein